MVRHSVKFVTPPHHIEQFLHEETAAVAACGLRQVHGKDRHLHGDVGTGGPEKVYDLFWIEFLSFTQP
jgi:hypothetical protein